MPDLISPDGLEADAVVPQCLDNQYVSDDIFNDMISRGIDYRDRAIAEARERNFRTEFIRSLVYSSQVVIQRAYFKNSDFLYKNYLPQNGQELQAFADLMRQGAIVPFLLRESSLADDTDFDVRREGDLATKSLLAELGNDVRCVRLAIDETQNSRMTESMWTAFGANLTRLNSLGGSERNSMAAELFRNPGDLQPEGAWQKFDAAIDQLTDYAFGKARERRRDGKKLSRNDVYTDLFAAGDSDQARKANVPLGRFKHPGADDPFLFELKKFVDLVYNVNLPDHLHRYTFTPATMPTRMALQDAPGIRYGHDQIRTSISNSEAMEWIARSFTAGTQSAMNLPLLSELTVADVQAIRQLPEWETFKDSQKGILTDPLHCLDNLPRFQETFDEFQRALSDWYHRTYKREQTIGRYCNFVSIALNIGGALVVAGAFRGPLPHDMADLAVPGVVASIPRRVKGYAAKLMVGVYDIDKRQLDKDRAYTIELMQSDEELLREDVIDLLNSVSVGSRESEVPPVASLTADQGIA
ncbi:MAG: hypothetical protein ABSA93_20500 [Streptosporangiaceae bacterium]|jgi:hypothetical protein